MIKGQPNVPAREKEQAKPQEAAGHVGLMSPYLHAPLHQASGIKSGYPYSFCLRSTI